MKKAGISSSHYPMYKRTSLSHGTWQIPFVFLPLTMSPEDFRNWTTPLLTRSCRRSCIRDSAAAFRNQESSLYSVSHKMFTAPCTCTWDSWCCRTPYGNKPLGTSVATICLLQRHLCLELSCAKTAWARAANVVKQWSYSRITPVSTLFFLLNGSSFCSVKQRIAQKT